MITVITLTGDRPLPFLLCQLWVSKQTVKPDQWIVIDDGKNSLPTDLVIDCEYVKRRRATNEPFHTLIPNLKEALNLIKNDKIIIFEDDEYYAPTYIERMSKLLDKYEMVGIGRSKYYHLPTRLYFKHNNMNHGSFAQTAFKSSFIPELRTVIEGSPFIDLRMWAKIQDIQEHEITPRDNKFSGNEIELNNRAFVFDDLDENLYLAMKGLPGRDGIGEGHKLYKYEQWGAEIDNDWEVLKKWVPNDYSIYKELRIE